MFGIDKSGRKHALVCAVGSVVAMVAGAARADTALFDTSEDWGGTGLKHGTSTGADGGTPFGWNGWGEVASYPDPYKAPHLHDSGNSADPVPVTYTTSISGGATNGIGNYDNTANNSNMADATAGTNFGGTASTTGGVTFSNPGGFLSIYSGELGGNTTLKNALIAGSGGTLAVDFTLPGSAAGNSDGAGGTNYFLVGLGLSGAGNFKLAAGNGTTYEGGTGHDSFGDFFNGTGDATPSTNTTGGVNKVGGNRDPGGFITKGANNVYTAFLPYTFTDSAPGTGYFSLTMIINNGFSTVDDTTGDANGGNITLDNLRIVSPTPEPASLSALALTGAGLLARRRRA